MSPKGELTITEHREQNSNDTQIDYKDKSKLQLQEG